MNSFFYRTGNVVAVAVLRTKDAVLSASKVTARETTTAGLSLVAGYKQALLDHKAERMGLGA